MPKVGRNAPCPCGSGKKYKKCCLRTDQSRESDARRREQGVELALDWLIQHHREPAMAHLRAEYFEPWDLNLLDDEEAVPRDALDLMWSNALEWLIAEGRLGLTEESPRALDVLLGADGPPLEPEQRAWLEAMGRQSLGLYEVEKVGAGGKMSLRDLDDPDRPPLAVYDRVVAEVVEVGAVFGARVLPVGDHHELAAAHYPFHDHLVPDLENQLDMLSEEPASPEDRMDPEERAWQVDRIVIESWLEQLVEDYLSLEVDSLGGDSLDGEEDSLL